MSTTGDLVKQKIKRILKNRKLSVYQLTNNTDISDCAVRNWYKRGYDPSIDSLEKICEFLGVSMAELMTKDDESTVRINDELKIIVDNWIYLSKYKKDIILKLMDIFLND